MNDGQTGRFTRHINTKVNDMAEPDRKSGQGEIYYHLDSIDLEIADFYFKFVKWIENNVMSESNTIFQDSSDGDVLTASNTIGVKL